MCWERKKKGSFFLISILNKNNEEKANSLTLWKIPLIIVPKWINYWTAFKKWCYCNNEWAKLICANAFEILGTFSGDGGGSWIFIKWGFLFLQRLQSTGRIQ